MITSEKPWDWNTYFVEMAAERVEPNLEKVNDFSRVLGHDFDDLLRKWHA